MRREEWLSPITKLKYTKETQIVHDSIPTKGADDKYETKADSMIILKNEDLVISSGKTTKRDSTSETKDTNMNDQPIYDHDNLRAYENGQISLESLTKEERKEARRRKKILAEQEEVENDCHSQITMEIDKETVIDNEKKKALLEEQARIELNNIADLIQKREEREKAALEQEQAENDRLIAECSNKQLEKIAKFRKNVRRD